MKRFQKGHYLAVLGLCWLCAGAVQADQAEDEAAIRKMVESYTAAFNKRDAKAVAAHWLPEAVYVDPDSREQIVGRETIEKHFAEEFSEIKAAKLTVSVESIRFISPHVALEQGQASVLEPGKEPSRSRYSAIHVKRDGKWLLDRVTDEDDTPAPSHYDKLKELEWMIGAWVDNDDDDETTVEIACKWAKNQNFLVRTYTLTIRDRISVSGVQMIGWDPSAKQIRSWEFDSDGGFSEGFWTKKGQAWYIQTKETLPDGKKASAVGILTLIDNNNFTWQSIDRQSGGVLLPNIGQVPVVRKGAE
jgi:uncharacterized protein (TIGR02246 family)